MADEQARNAPPLPSDALVIGFAAGRTKPAAAATDPHADHDMSAMPSMAGFQQSMAIPASATTAMCRKTT